MQASRNVLCSLALSILAFAGAAAAQVPAPEKAAPAKPAAGVIEGKVMRATSDEPLRGARVELRVTVEGDEDQAHEVVTDTAGKFSFPELKAGKYMLTVRKAGFVTQEYGERESPSGRMQGSPITLAAGVQMRDLLFRLVPSAVITGRVFDSAGEPLAEVEVSASQPMALGRENMMLAAAQDSTDDRGEYRLFGLAPGKYVVSASPTGSQFNFSRMMRSAARGGPARDVPRADSERGAQTYYPGVLDAKSATPVEVEAGREMPGIDIRIMTVRVFTVRGTVTVTAGTKPGDVHLALWNTERMADMNLRTTLKEDGTFEIPNVQPGKYRLIGMAIGMEGGGGFNSQTFAQQEVIVGNADVSSIALSMGGGAEVAGRVKIEGRPALPRLTMVMLTPKEGDEFRGAYSQVKEDGSFQMKNVTPGDYSVMAGGGGAADEFYLKEARLGGRDVRDSLSVPAGGSLTLEILLGTDGGVVTGRVTDADNLPAPGAHVFLAPPDARSYRSDAKQSQADQMGRFEIKGVRPGEYRLVAVAGGENFAGLMSLGEDGLKTLIKKGKTVQVAASGQHTMEVQITVPDKQ